MRDLVDLSVFARPDHLGELPEPSRVGGVIGAVGGLVQQGGAFQRFTAQIRDPGLEFRGKLVLPAAKRVRPGFDGVFVDRVFVDRADAPPAIVIDVRHRGLVPARFAEKAPLQRGRNHIVPVLENIRFDGQIVPHDALDRISPAIDRAVADSR